MFAGVVTRNCFRIDQCVSFCLRNPHRFLFQSIVTFKKNTISQTGPISVTMKATCCSTDLCNGHPSTTTTTSAKPDELTPTAILVTTIPIIEVSMKIPEPIETIPYINETISVNVTVPETNLTTTSLTPKKNATIIKPAPEIPPLIILAPKTNHTNVTIPDTITESVTMHSTPPTESESTTQETDSTAGSSSLNSGSGLLMILVIVASRCR